MNHTSSRLSTALALGRLGVRQQPQPSAAPPNPDSTIGAADTAGSDNSPSQAAGGQGSRLWRLFDRTVLPGAALPAKILAICAYAAAIIFFMAQVIGGLAASAPTALSSGNGSGDGATGGHGNLSASRTLADHTVSSGHPAAATASPAAKTAAAAPPPAQSVPAGISQPIQTGNSAAHAASARQPLLFGLGAEADGALRQPLARDAPLRMLSSWYNSPSDLGFMRGWQTTLVPQAYAKGYALHLIVWTGGAEGAVNTAYGPACGRSYPFSSSFASDMRQLATIFNGSGTLYVSMFTEFQTYPCHDNVWSGNENYFRGLQDQYRLAENIFHQYAPHSQVSLSWGGWQSSWDDPANGGGRSLLPYFASLMNGSDFQSFQAMDSTSNVQDVSDMTRLLHAYGTGRVMVSHFKPDNGSQTTWSNDLNGIFTPDNVASLEQNGLFAFSFMDETNMNSSPAAYQQALGIVQTYGQ